MSLQLNVSGQGAAQFVAGQVVTPEFVQAQWSSAGASSKWTPPELGHDAATGPRDLLMLLESFRWGGLLLKIICGCVPTLQILG